MRKFETELSARQTIVNAAYNFLGVTEGSASHHGIIDQYNSVSPLPRGYKVKYTDAWCATFVTFIFDICEMSALIERECGCQEMINKCKERGIVDFAKKSSSINIGNLVFYDWDKNGRSDHVGIIYKYTSKYLYVIEGNYQDEVKMRTIDINSPLIQCYITPSYNTCVAYDYDNLGWNKDDTGWWYAFGHKKGEYYKNCVINLTEDDAYAFDVNGYVCDMTKTTLDEKGAIKEIRGNIYEEK